jgi:hypothetical protein
VGGGSATVNVTAMMLQKINMQTFAWKISTKKDGKIDTFKGQSVTLMQKFLILLRL